LSIVHRLVTVLGGEITVSSEVGWGSTFRIELPCHLPEAAPRASDAPGLPARRRAA
jgi:signal transduction histidine kinase